MIRNLIHSVNRFFPLILTLLCVSFFGANTAHADSAIVDTGYPTATTTDDSGSFATVIPDVFGTSHGAFTADTIIIMVDNRGQGYSCSGITGGGANVFYLAKDIYPTYYNNPLGAPPSTCTETDYGVPDGSGWYSQTMFKLTWSSPFSIGAGERWGMMFNNGSFFRSIPGVTSDTLGTGSHYKNFNTGADISTIVYPYLKVCANSTCTVPAPTPSSCSGYSHICGFTPENGTTVSGPDVTFTLDYFVTQADIDQNLNDVVVTLHNIDQNVLLLGFLSPGDKELYRATATTSGEVNFSTTTPLADGNYRLQAKMERKFFFDWITVPFDSINQTISKQFVVGTPTFIGNLSQNGFNILNGTLASSTATSSVALVANCNPLGTFDMVNCLAGLFVPDANQIQVTIQGAQQGILTRMPWGYITRFVGIIGGNGTTTLSTTYSVEVAMNNASDTTQISFNPGEMFTGGASLVDSIHSPYDSSVTFRSVFEPIIKLSIALLVLFQIVHDITGSHSHHSEAEIGARRRRKT